MAKRVESLELSRTRSNIFVKVVSAKLIDHTRFLESPFVGIKDEGLFRRSPNSALLKQVQEAYDRGVSYFLRGAVVLSRA